LKSLIRQSPKAANTTSHGLNLWNRGYQGEVDIEDGATHAILWTRDRDGRMQIDLDGESLIQVTDRGFTDPFRGVVMVNDGGDYAVRSMVVKGTP
ncbi:hypothetical protein, partial [Arhodomonas sp. SL1]|uniref:hypothetical protein n=1 Tax=Arhodomonas sp. SL1 TaxID=3425691 RepID=UPI003F8813EB